MTDGVDDEAPRVRVPRAGDGREESLRIQDGWVLSLGRGGRGKKGGEIT